MAKKSKYEIIGIPMVLTGVFVVSLLSAFITLPVDLSLIMGILGLYVAFVAKDKLKKMLTDMAVILSIVGVGGSIIMVGTYIATILGTILPFAIVVAVVGQLMQVWEETSLG